MEDTMNKTNKIYIDISKPELVNISGGCKENMSFYEKVGCAAAKFVKYLESGAVKSQNAYPNSMM